MGLGNYGFLPIFWPSYSLFINEKNDINMNKNRFLVRFYTIL